MGRIKLLASVVRLAHDSKGVLSGSCQRSPLASRWGQFKVRAFGHVILPGGQ
jgi:hypothetical protein